MLSTSLSLPHIRQAPRAGTQVAFILRRKSSGLEKHACVCAWYVRGVCAMQWPREACAGVMLSSLCVKHVCVYVLHLWRIEARF